MCILFFMFNSEVENVYHLSMIDHVMYIVLLQIFTNN